MRRLLLLLILVGAALPAAAMTIDRDTVWRGEISIPEVVRVEVGATLTVMPGTKVTFRGGKLEVAGRLLAENADFSGTSWEGIMLKGCDERTLLSGGRVSGAKTGIFIGGGAPRIQDVTVEGNEVGIEIKQQSAAQVSDCRIVANRKVGLFVKDEATPVISGNRIEANGKFGAYIYRAQPQRFAGNRFTDNEIGLMIANAGSDPVIDGNRFEKNRTGISVDRAARPQLRDNLLRLNQVGVRLYRRADAHIEGNRFERNGDAVSVAYSSYPTVRRNDFVANRRALFLEFQSATWEQEKGEVIREAEAGSRSAFGQSAGHAAAAGERRRPEALTGVIDARENWWGVDETAELVRIGSNGNPTFIHDGRDQPNFVEGGKDWPLDRVIYAPWLAAPIGFKERP